MGIHAKRQPGCERALYILSGLDYLKEGALRQAASQYAECKQGNYHDYHIRSFSSHYYLQTIYSWSIFTAPHPIVTAALVTFVLTAIYDKALILPINQWITELSCNTTL